MKKNATRFNLRLFFCHHYEKKLLMDSFFSFDMGKRTHEQTKPVSNRSSLRSEYYWCADESTRKSYQTPCTKHFIDLVNHENTYWICHGRSAAEKKNLANSAKHTHALRVSINIHIVRRPSKLDLKTVKTMQKNEKNVFY